MLAPLLLLLYFTGHTFAQKTPDVVCMVINLKYVHCSWNRRGTPEVNCSFYSRFHHDSGFRECATYVSENSTHTGCDQPYDTLSEKRFSTFYTKLVCSNNSIEDEHKLKKRVKLNPPINLSVLNGSDGNLWFYWNHSASDCGVSEVRYRINNYKLEIYHLSVGKNSYCINLPSSSSLCELQVKSTISRDCGGSDFWSDWSQSVFWGSMRENNSTAALAVASSCLHTASALRECATLSDIGGKTHLEVKCSESVRLVNGSSLCSGRVEVKSQQSWSSVCEDDFNLQDAEVVCRELGCGAPSVLQGALYGELESPVWSNEFHCEGNESVLLECGSSGSLRNSCSPGKAVGLTCSELDYIRLLGEASRCAGTLQIKQQSKWRQGAVIGFTGDLRLAAAVCKQLDCGSALSVEREDSSRRAVTIRLSCIQPDSALRECLSVPTISESTSSMKVICSDLLVQPIISLSPSIDGAQQQGHRVLLSSSFTINCSVEPQYPGGSFQLIVTTSKTALNYTLPAVNHSAHFHFSEANHTHRGDFSCVYHVYVFSHNFSSVSRPLSLSVSASVTELIIRVVVHLLIIVVVSVPLCFYCKSTRRQKPETEENIEMDYYNLGGSRAEGGVGDTTGAPPMGQEASRNLLPPHV